MLSLNIWKCRCTLRVMAQRKIMKDFSMLGLPNLNSCFILINVISFCDDSAECIII